MGLQATRRSQLSDLTTDAAGSECSIHIGTGIRSVREGTLQGMHLVTSDIGAIRAELVGRGVR